MGCDPRGMDALIDSSGGLRAPFPQLLVAFEHFFCVFERPFKSSKALARVRFDSIQGARFFLVCIAGCGSRRFVELERPSGEAGARVRLRPRSGEVESKTSVYVILPLAECGDAAAVREAADAAVLPLAAIGCPARIDLRHEIQSAAGGGGDASEGIEFKSVRVSEGWRRRPPEDPPELQCDLFARGAGRDGGGRWVGGPVAVLRETSLVGR